LSIIAIWWLRRTHQPSFWIVVPVLTALLILQLGGGHISSGYPGLPPDKAQTIAKWVRFHEQDPYTVVTMSNEFHIYFYTGLFTGNFVHHWYSPNQLDHFEGILKQTKGPWLSLVADHVHIEPAYSGKELEWWLNQHLYRIDAQWVEGYELVRYALLPATDWDWQPFQKTIGPFDLKAFAVHAPRLSTHDALGVQLQVCKAAEVPASYKIFLHLLRDDGELVPGLDGALRYGGGDVAQWEQGDCVIERRGIYIPPDAKAGDYTLVVGVRTPEGNIMTTDEMGASVAYQTLTTVGVSGSK
jgi:hypothetical protein